MRGIFIPAGNAPNYPFLGISFRRTGPNAAHVGLAWRDSRGKVFLFHQQWHMSLSLDSAFHDNDAIVHLDIPKPRIEPTIRWALRVHGKVGTALPYAFRLPNDVFSKETGALLLRRGEGVTCSTFVLALLKSAGIDLLKVEEWPQREDDEVRHRQLAEDLRIAYVRQYGSLTDVATEHLAYLRTQFKAVRFRPEEVAAAAAVAPRPASFVDTAHASLELLCEYDRHFSPGGEAPPPGDPSRHTNRAQR